jgi:hypothetical protein
VTASKSTVERLLEVILKHVPKETALKILEELMTVPGNKSFRDTGGRFTVGRQHRSPCGAGRALCEPAQVWARMHPSPRPVAKVKHRAIARGEDRQPRSEPNGRHRNRHNQSRQFVHRVSFHRTDPDEASHAGLSV